MKGRRHARNTLLKIKRKIFYEASGLSGTALTVIVLLEKKLYKLCQAVRTIQQYNLLSNDHLPPEAVIVRHAVARAAALHSSIPLLPLHAALFDSNRIPVRILVLY